MAQKTNIGWTDHTFNPVWGCAKVSPGCKNCYAEALASRYGAGVWGPGAPRRTFGDKHWAGPRTWNRAAEKAGERRRVFCGSMCDVFEDHVTVNAERLKLWPLIKQTPNLDWLLLTKRPENVLAMLPQDWGQGYPNVWLGASVEGNDYAWRADCLRAVPAAVRFVSYEPALGPVDALALDGLHWVIYGGESGPGHRAEDKRWARDMRDRCRAAGVAFYHKQSAGPLPERGVELDGQVLKAFPSPPRVPLTLFG